MTRVSTRLLALTVGAVCGVSLLAACSGGSKKPVSTGSSLPSSSASTSTKPTATATPKPKPKPVNPLTGIAPPSSEPVVAVKIDDTAPGRRQVGIDKADIVYIEAAEGGLTRLAAIYDTYRPTAVGYVRSTRPSDPDLLLQFGKITEAYSGGAHDSLPLVYKSGIKSWSNDAGSPFYSRVNRSESSYINLVLNVAKVSKATKTPAAKTIGWTFSPSLAGLPSSTGTRIRTTVTGSYGVGSGTPVEFRYSSTLKKYIRYIDGQEQFAADGKPVATTNVIVQSCRVVSHPADTDVNGNPSQFTYTIGKGTVSVFRGGRRIDGTWARGGTTGGTILHTTSGARLALAPGNTWVVLIRSGVPVSGA